MGDDFDDSGDDEPPDEILVALAELRASFVDECESAARLTLLALAFLACGIFAVREGEIVGHLLGILGLVFGWLARKPIAEAVRLREEMRDLGRTRPR